MKTEGIKYEGYTAIYSVYEAGVDFEPSDALYAMKTLTCYRLHGGYKLWRVEATYSRNIKPSFYYVVATNRAAAMSKFLTVTPWLAVIKSIVPLNEADTEVVLNNPAKYVMW